MRWQATTPLVVALLLWVDFDQAHALSARVRWLPTSDEAVAGYYVYVRPAGERYCEEPTCNGQPDRGQWDAGLPLADTDGTMTTVVQGLNDLATVGAYYFALTAYNSDRDQSALSNEVHLGDVDPCVVDRCPSLEFCDFGTLANGTSCADDNACNGAEACQGGVCTPGAPPNCDDGNVCTTDVCNLVSGCVHIPTSGCRVCTVNAHCGAYLCTAGVCRDGLCEYTAVTDGTSCTDGNACNGAEICQGGLCMAGTPLNCNDGNACTNDVCNPLSGCVHTPTSGCQACASTAQCNDANPCTADVCSQGRCQHTPVAYGTSCAFHSACAASGFCQAGVCEQSSLTELQVKRFKVKLGRSGPELSAGGILWPAVPLDPTRTGVTLEIADNSGAVLYQAVVPGDDLVANRRGTSFKLDPSKEVGASGLLRLSLRQFQSGRVRAIVKATASELANALELSQLTWILRPGEECFLAADLACLHLWSGGIRCR